ncbi:MAG: NAD(P)/FAD-dependent oxidoreductase, partial [Polyangiales bacterium]
MSALKWAQQATFDVLVVGGRPAGASLAARLGAAGVRVLIVDKARFPSRPAVSAPFVLPHALGLLDELGVSERDYARDTPRLSHYVLEYGNHFRARLGFTQPIAGRDYFYAVERSRFDACLWDNLSRFPNVLALSQVHAHDLLRDASGRVCGVLASADGEPHPVPLRAACVVGADGRHSLIARKLGLSPSEQRFDVDTSLHYAHWQNVGPLADEAAPVAHIHSAGDGFGIVFMPSADGETMVLAQGRSDRYDAGLASPQARYEAVLRARPSLWQRLAHAKQVSKLHGMKRLGNLFRPACGPGWALVGDAYHQKDSIDAQGIYDALLGARVLAQMLIAWQRGEVGLSQALEDYRRAIYTELKPMFDFTLSRVKRELYGSPPPPVVARSVLRWIVTSEAYGKNFGALVTRRLAPEQLMRPRAMLG